MKTHTSFLKLSHNHQLTKQNCQLLLQFFLTLGSVNSSHFDYQYFYYLEFIRESTWKNRFFEGEPLTNKHGFSYVDELTLLSELLRKLTKMNDLVYKFSFGQLENNVENGEYILKYNSLYFLTCILLTGNRFTGPKLIGPYENDDINFGRRNRTKTDQNFNLARNNL